MIEFLQANWGKLSALSVAGFHAVILHRREIGAVFGYLRENGGVYGVGKQFIFGDDEFRRRIDAAANMVSTPSVPPVPGPLSGAGGTTNKQ